MRNIGLVLGLACALALTESLPLRAEADIRSALPETTARPLFRPDRRAYLPPPAPAAEVEEVVAVAMPEVAPVAGFTLSAYRLRGVVISGDQPIALLEDVASGRIQRLRPGPATLNGAGEAPQQVEVVEITARGIVLRAGGLHALTLHPVAGRATPPDAGDQTAALIPPGGNRPPAPDLPAAPRAAAAPERTPPARADASPRRVLRHDADPAHVAPLVPGGLAALTPVRVVAVASNTRP